MLSVNGVTGLPREDSEGVRFKVVVFFSLLSDSYTCFFFIYVRSVKRLLLLKRIRS